MHVCTVKQLLPPIALTVAIYATSAGFDNQGFTLSVNPNNC